LRLENIFPTRRCNSTTEKQNIPVTIYEELLAKTQPKSKAILLLVYSPQTRGLTSAGEMCHVFFETMGGSSDGLGVAACAPVIDIASQR